MQVGNKIRKIRELKNISPKDIADRLNITSQNYLKIERDELNLSVERLLQISDIFGMKPEEILTFDEKMVFNNHAEVKGSIQGGSHHVQNNFPEEMKNLYEDKSRLQEDKIRLLEDKLRWMEEKINWLEKGKE